MTYTQIWNSFDNRLSPHILRDEDGAVIPDDDRNADWRAYQAWLDEGNTPNPPVSPPTPPIETPPPPDIVEVNAQVQDIDQRLTALEEEVAGKR